MSRDEVLQMSIAEQSNLLQQNPVTGVHMFQHRVESFFSQYILGGSQPLGNVTDYVIKIEFQMRGSPHAHCLLWVKDTPRIGHNTDDEVCAFVDKYITAVMPKPCKENEHDISMMKRLKKHTHSDYCRLYT